MGQHLCKYGFTPDYTRWTLHGEAHRTGDEVVRAGGGKKHGRFWLGDNVVDTASTRTLSQLRARTTDSTPPIRPWPETSVATVRAIQVISAPFVVRCF